MSHTAWPTLTDVNGVVSGLNVTLTTAFSTALQQQILDGVIKNITQETHRSFIPYTATQYYDGNESGEIQVDEFTSLTSVVIVGWYGVTSGLTLDNVQPVIRPTFATDRIQIYRGSIPALYRYWVDRFPAGRQNIAISATWGYDVTIPDDLWLGCEYQAAGIMVNISKHDPKGFNVKWEEAGVTEVRNYMDVFKYFKTGTTYKGLIEMYRKPSSYFIRKQAKRLV